MDHHYIGGVVVTELQRRPPPAKPGPRMVAYLGCNQPDRYASGLYRLTDMDHLYDAPPKEPLERDRDGNELVTRSIVERAQFVVVDDCRPNAAALAEGFQTIYKRPEATLYARPPH